MQVLFYLDPFHVLSGPWNMGVESASLVMFNHHAAAQDEHARFQT